MSLQKQVTDQVDNLDAYVTKQCIKLGTSQRAVTLRGWLGR